MQAKSVDLVGNSDYYTDTNQPRVSHMDLHLCTLILN